MISRISENLKDKNTKQTDATHSHLVSKNQPRITPKAQRYSIDDELVPYDKYYRMQSN